jgi:hypothetical protein
MVCSQASSSDALTNACKAMILSRIDFSHIYKKKLSHMHKNLDCFFLILLLLLLSQGFWITFVDLECLSAKLRQTLSSTFSSMSEKNEHILMNKEKLKVNTTTHHKPLGCFAIVQPVDKCLADSLVDMLKSTKVEHYVSLIGKDLLDKFRLVHCECVAGGLEDYLRANLSANGLDESLSVELIKLIFIYENLLKSIINRNGT